MRRLTKTKLTKKEALTLAGGYTFIHPSTYIVFDNQPFAPFAALKPSTSFLKNDTDDSFLRSVIVTGIEYGASGESLNLTQDQVKEIVFDIAGEVGIQLGEGGYTSQAGSVVEETCVVIDGANHTDQSRHQE